MIGSVEPLIVNDVERIDDFQTIPAVTVFRMRSYIGVPIILSTGRLYGTLCALDRVPQEKTQRDLDTLLILARLLASQIDREALGALEERQRIAREIHDTLAQSLSVLALDLSMHATRLRFDAPQFESEVQRMHEAVRRSLQEVRRSIWNLQPDALDGRTLSEAIGIELRETARLGIEASIELRGTPVPLPTTSETSLLRIAQEALANVRKHSGATQTIVTLEYRDDDVTLRVDDDGRGVNLAAVGSASIEGGFGLTSMRERARLAGGELRIELRPGGGTSLTCVIPRARRDAVDAAVIGPTDGGPAQAPQTNIRVGLVDDHPIVREGIRTVVNAAPDCAVIWDAGDHLAGLTAMRSQAPEVVLLDLQMPGGGGLEFLRQVRTLGLPTRVIVLTTFAQDEVVFDAIKLGACGYVLKDGSSSDLLQAIRTVAAGGTMIAPVAADLLAKRVQSAEALTPREREVLTLLADGLRYKEIAQHLGTSEKTVQFHTANIFGKLGVTSRTEATRIAIRRGLVSATSS